MKKSRFSEAQIVGILKELEAGSPATELGRRHGVHPHTIRLWTNKYAGLESSDLAWLKQLEAENAQMQRIIARQIIEIGGRPLRYWDKVERLRTKRRPNAIGPVECDGRASRKDRRSKRVRFRSDCMAAARLQARVNALSRTVELLAQTFDSTLRGEP